MKQYLLLVLLAIVFSPAPLVSAQTVPQRQGAAFELSEYGVDLQADQRLIVVMAALDAAGFDPLPAGREVTGFRAKVRKDLAGLDPDLQARLKTSYERNRLPAPATTADQAARYT